MLTVSELNDFTSQLLQKIQVKNVFRESDFVVLNQTADFF